MRAVGWRLALPLAQSLAHMPVRVALSDTRGPKDQTQFEGTGLVELGAAAITPIATVGIPLAAAEATVDSRPSDRLPFSVAASAERGGAARLGHGQAQGCPADRARRARG